MGYCAAATPRSRVLLRYSLPAADDRSERGTTTREHVLHVR
jgi:hypothetical protein